MHGRRVNKPMESNEKQEDPETELFDFAKPDFYFEPKQHHEWRQRGPYLVCKSCEIEHAAWVGMDKVLVGLNEEGQPLLKSR